jgi:hypothetical protein
MKTKPICTFFGHQGEDKPASFVRGHKITREHGGKIWPLFCKDCKEKIIYSFMIFAHINDPGVLEIINEA